MTAFIESFWVVIVGLLGLAVIYWADPINPSDATFKALTFSGGRIGTAWRMAVASYAYSRSHGLSRRESLAGAWELFVEYARARS